MNIKTLPFANVTPERDVTHMPLVTYEAVVAENPEHLVLMTHLFQALSLCRAGDSETEASFVATLCSQLSPDKIDGAGNLHFDRRVMDNGDVSRTLFTSHTDTVHRVGGHQGIRLDGPRWVVDTGGYCLGADDGSGIALIAHMMAHGVPGYYVLFRGEESGGIGSSWAAANMQSMYEDFDRAIAFDRADVSDVITYQSGGRCCSDEFAEALSTSLSSVHDDVMYMPCDGGVYTDTAEFIDIIPECTNLSVGYKHQHGSREYQDVVFLKKLADVVVTIDWEALPTTRDPKVREPKWPKFSRAGAYGWDGDEWTGKYASDTLLGSFPTTPVYDTVLDDTGLDACDDFAVAEDALNQALDGQPNSLLVLLGTALSVEYQGSLAVPDPGYEPDAFVLALQRAWAIAINSETDREHFAWGAENALYASSSVHDWACELAEGLLAS